MDSKGGIGYDNYFDGKTLSGAGLPYRLPSGESHQPFQLESSRLKEIQTRITNVGEFIKREMDKPERETLLRCGLSWFNRSYNEHNWENVLIDIMICLEILYVRGLNEKGVKGDHIRDRIGCFIEKTGLLEKGQQKELVEKDVALAYTIRNSVVHEGNVYKIVYDSKKETAEPRNAEKYLIDLRDHARSSLLGYFQCMKIDKIHTAREIKEALCLCKK